jgi:lysophospholipase L1-like esterase
MRLFINDSAGFHCSCGRDDFFGDDGTVTEATAAGGQSLIKLAEIMTRKITIKKFLNLFVALAVLSALTTVAAEEHPAMPVGMDAKGAGGGGKVTAKLEARGHNPDVLAGLEVKPAGGMKVTVAAGKVRVLGREVAVTKTTLKIAPAPVLKVTDEATTHTDEVPMGYGKGTALVHCIGFEATLAGCLEPGSVVIKDKPGRDGLVYEQGKDWRADESWGRVGRLPEGRIKAGQTVYIDYRVHLLRMDTIGISLSGKVSLNQGCSQKVCPAIPAADYGSLALCHIFLDYGCKEITAKEIYPVGEVYQPDAATINAYRARVTKTREKLEQGQDVTIVAWGDSVTAGGDASRPELRFPNAFVQALRYKYPNARIKLINAGRGGWFSGQSLPLFEDDVLKYKPDLVTMEFINDMGLSESNLRTNWFEAIDRVRAIGSEVVIVTPNFVLPMWMNFTDNSTPETRTDVEVLRKIADEKQVALADASKRWEHLAVEGVPYLIHLRNGINHPDDFAHEMFVEELMRLF